MRQEPLSLNFDSVEPLSLEYEYEIEGLGRPQQQEHCSRCRCGETPGPGHCQGCVCSHASDLQLAAELGKTLLERNKELESSLKQQQAVIDDQAQEIEYLNKQTTALREVNDSRLRIYEQLEISIAEMEKANSRLVEESVSDKARIKCLTMSTSQLEQRCEELQRAVEEARGQERVRRRRERRRSSQKEEGKGSRKASQETSGLNGKGGDQEEEEEEEDDECLLGESGYSSTSYSGYSSSTRTESISPHSNTREEPASQVRSLGNTVA